MTYSSFVRPGGLYRVTPTGPHGTFEAILVEELPGRVRDALLLPGHAGEVAEVATVSRAGRLRLLRMTVDGPQWTTVHDAGMGIGRVTVGRIEATGGATVLYTGLDDGRVLRHARGTDGTWTTETIFLGPQGTRGLVAGRFHADPSVESVAVFGYGGKVQLLTRSDAGWEEETIFVDRDKGHWLSVAELDGRNATDEILCSGYGGRIVYLGRPPGYGRSELTDR